MALSKILLATVFCILCCYVSASNILGVFPMPAKSHMSVFKPLLLELAKRGHNLTVINGFGQDPPVRNYKDIIVNVNPNKLLGTKDIQNTADIRRKRRSNFLIEHLWNFGYVMCEQVLQDPQIQELLQSKQHFDLIIVEAFSSECFFSFSHVFKAPFIQICAHSGTYWVTDAVGNPNPFAYIPDHLTSFGDHMSLPQRVYNTFIGTAVRLGHNYLYIPKVDQIMRKYIKTPDDDPLPPLSELEKKTSLIFLNNHFSVSPPKPLLPNVIDIAGIHINLPQKVTGDVGKFLDEATDGVIYISFGTNIKSATLPAEKRSAIIGAISKIKEKVIWKWEDDNMTDKPENVFLGKWFNQTDLLGHKNIRAFVTHGGLSSTQEAVFHGVPLVGLPMVADQKHNLALAEKAGYAIVLDFDALTEDILYNALNTVLHDDTYRNKSKEISRIFRDRPMAPLQEAVYWTEYVIRHKGAAHMRSGALDLTWYQYLLLDVVAIFLSCFVIVLAVLYICVRTLSRLLFAKKSKETIEPKSKKSAKKTN